VTTPTPYRPPTQGEAWARVARALWRWLAVRARIRVARARRRLAR
jgi:hypothetical protein